MNKSENPLSQDFTLFSLLRFAFPSIVMMIFMGLYTIIDTIFVSRLINTNALSAVNIVCPVINIIIGLASMIATGGNAIVARKMGANNRKRANQDFTLLIIFGALLGLVITILGVIFIDEIIWGLGSSEILYPYCRSYLLVILIFTPASILQVLFQNLIITAGKPTLGLILSVGAGVINIIFDYIFMVTFKMGIAGSALGTGIGYIVPTVVGIIIFLKGKGMLKFVKPILDIGVLIESSYNGFSEMVSQISTAITTFLFNLIMMNLLGENGVAAITIIIYTQFMLTALYIGFSMGVAPIISYNYGAKNYQRLKKIFKNCMICISIMSILVWLVSLFGGSSLISIFSPQGTKVFEITNKGFPIFKYSFLLCGFNIFSSAMFTALSNGKISAIISFLRTFVFIAVGLLVLPKMLNVLGVWIAVPIAEFLTLIISGTFILKYRSKYQKFLV
ncbi:multidrug transporter MatE [Vallitalea longa]|uniref:Multidrug export protein MepA n=1 Tax=Vallitalea longa TaxID=2936439 RepID=A0A9W5Y7K8_9FIRM|nr:MATE family efflux transporter [Vallitalea longa]GKX28342.1 multidrug transporter MatE [Vallitalea longa]